VLPPLLHPTCGWGGGIGAKGRRDRVGCMERGVCILRN